MKAKKLIAVFGLCLGLAACSEQGVVDPTSAAKGSSQEESPMTFSMKVGNQSRADGLETEHYDFGVWAYKGSDYTQAANTVMTNYLVGYATTDGVGYHARDIWEDPTKAEETWGESSDIHDGTSYWVYENMGSSTAKDDNQYNYRHNLHKATYPNYVEASVSENSIQYLKYWDLSKAYEFFAYSPYIYREKATDGKKYVTFDASQKKMTFPMHLYMGLVDGTNDVDYMYGHTVVDKPTICNSDGTTSGTAKNHVDDVSITFTRLLGQMQIGIYEDIKGYHVKMDEVNITSTVGTTDIRGIAAIPVNYDATATESPKFTRTSYQVGGIPTIDFNNKKVEFASPVTSNQTGCFSIAGMSNLSSEGYIADRTEIDAVTTKTVSMSPDVYRIIPQQACGFQVVMNFDLIADDTKEVIEVRNARVYIEPTYTKWEENTVYTYIFKITKNTSGTTVPPEEPEDPDNPQDPDPDKPALYPIVFDQLMIADLNTADNVTVWAVNPGDGEENPIEGKKTTD
ncbi:MAG: fimbrillin family protein [Bacteroidales bacterium]|nr:fimbrillin family protein [Bacteroidales bacterium]